MEITVFYAWQSDRDTKVNRYFIQEAVEKALKRITNDASLDFSLKLDHDTKDVPGMPEITTTILKKIEESHIFLADLTFVATTEAEKPEEKAKYLPNPNVLFELGYAFKVLGSERIICVMNTAFGNADLQIFDLAHRRWPVRYELKNKSQENKTAVKRSLSAEIESAIRSILKSGSILRQENRIPNELRQLVQESDFSLHLGHKSISNGRVKEHSLVLDNNGPKLPHVVKLETWEPSKRWSIAFNRANLKLIRWNEVGGATNSEENPRHNVHSLQTQDDGERLAMVVMDTNWSGDVPVEYLTYRFTYFGETIKEDKLLIP